MALDTYANLQASIASWLNREDLAAQIPDFIALAEAKFDRELRVNAMVGREVTTASSDYVELPSDWLQTISAAITSPANTYSALRYIGPEEYNDLRNDGLTGTSRMYTIINNNMLLLPAPEASVTIEIIYYKKIPALSASAATNWLLQRSQDLYLYASLIQAEAFLQNDERIPLWAGAVERIIADMKMESERDRRPQGALMARRKTFG